MPIHHYFVAEAAGRQALVGWARTRVSITADDSGLRPDLGESDGCNALVCVERGAAALCCDRTDCSTAAVLRSIIPFEAAAKVKAVDSPITTSVDSLASVFSRLGGDGLFNTGMGRGFALLYGIHILLIG